jgi:hypothetical protein
MSPDFSLEIFLGAPLFIHVHSLFEHCIYYVSDCTVTAENRKHSVFNGNTIRNCCNPSWAIAGACHLSDNIVTDSKGDNHWLVIHIRHHTE